MFCIYTIGGSVVAQTHTRQRLEVLLLHRHVQDREWIEALLFCICTIGGSVVAQTHTRQRPEVLLLLHMYTRQRPDVLLLLHKHLQDRDRMFYCCCTGIYKNRSSVLDTQSDTYNTETGGLQLDTYKTETRGSVVVTQTFPRQTRGTNRTKDRSTNNEHRLRPNTVCCFSS